MTRDDFEPKALVSLVHLLAKRMALRLSNVSTLSNKFFARRILAWKKRRLANVAEVPKKGPTPLPRDIRFL